MWFQQQLKWAPHTDVFAVCSTDHKEQNKILLCINNALSIQCCLFILFAGDLISAMCHSGPCPKSDTKIMQSSSPEGETVQVPPAFSALKGWSRAWHAIAQEGVLLTQLSPTSHNKPWSDAWLTLENRPELRIRNRSHDLASKSGDLWFQENLSVAKSFLQARWSHCPYPAAVPEMGMRQKSHGPLSFPSVPKH